MADRTDARARALPAELRYLGTRLLRAVPLTAAVLGLLVLAAVLTPLVVGLPLAAVALRLAHHAAGRERAAAAALLGEPVPATAPLPRSRWGVATLRCPAAWGDLAGVVRTLPLALLGVVAPLACLAAGPGGLLVPLWPLLVALADGGGWAGLAEARFPVPERVFPVVAGAVLLLATPAVVRALARLQARLSLTSGAAVSAGSGSGAADPGHRRQDDEQDSHHRHASGRQLVSGSLSR